MIFIEFAALVLLFTLLLESDDDETHKDVDHEEGNHDDVGHVENSYHRAAVEYLSIVLIV